MTTVTVVPYDSNWINLFETEARLVKQALGDNCITLHHIGSTAVPDLAAKPVIDIIPVVRDITLVDSVTKNMEALGYEAKAEFGMLFRRFFQKEGVNVHVYEEGNPVIERHLLFRDWLRTHPEDKQTYAKLKGNLALQYPHDIYNYCLGKEDFVTGIDEKTGFNGLHIVKALTPREWKAARHLHQHYFFDKVPILDPYTWTFEHIDHIHLILYQGNKIIGYAHIQIWPASRAAMRIVVIDEAYRNHGNGREFLQRCERWLKQQNIISLHVQSSPDAYRFYRQNGYIEIPFNDPDEHESNARDIEMGKKL